MLLDVFFKAADPKDHGITQILVVIAGKMLDHDAFQVGQQRFYSIFRTLLVAQMECILFIGITTPFYFFTQLQSVREPFLIIMFDACRKLFLERGEEFADQVQRIVSRCAHRDERS